MFHLNSHQSRTTTLQLYSQITPRLRELKSLSPSQINHQRARVWNMWNMCGTCVEHEENMWNTSYHSSPTFDQCGSSTQHDGGEQCASEVHVRLLDGVGQDLVDPRALVSDQVGSEQQLRSSEPGRTDLKGRPHIRTCSQREILHLSRTFAGLTFKVLPSGRTY